ncbi:MAG TPA: NADH-quinone oxidoreductase subunit L [bacterium]|nr:NADH-quinone oxidoreductase subunit L [bacterium]
MSVVTAAAVLIPLLPLAGWAVLGLRGGRWPARAAGWFASATVAASFAAAVTLFQALAALPAGTRSVEVDVYRWIAAGPVVIPFRLLADPLSAAMARVVAGVGTLIHIYSIGYMAGEPGFARYFAYMNLFMAAMLLLVLAGNLAVMFIGWEGVGLCSYLLIAFWFDRPAAARAGVKAFVVTRLGDVGFLLGIFAAFGVFGTLDFTTITRDAAARLALGGGAATAIALLLFLGAVGKSAQLPLYVWLPDAMEGPTPVSALIHAATMVTAGVYMIVRLHALYLRAPFALDVVAVTGAVTAIFAASAALVEPDLKRVLAYSTISQLGYMFLAVGAAAWTAGMFHLMTHAFFKALLFLAAGAVMHALGGETDMRKMGGLGRRLPRTAAAFGAGALALAGIPPLAGYFSKEQILGEVFAAGHVWLWAVGLITAGLTAFYITRAYALTFGGAGASAAGPVRGAQGGHAAGAGAPHDPPPVMWWPIAALIFLTIVMGIVLEHVIPLAPWLRPTLEAGVPRGTGSGAQAGAAGVLLPLAGIAVAASGIVLGWLVYARGAVRGQEAAGGRPEVPGPAALVKDAQTGRVPALGRLLAHRFFIEDLYAAAVVAPSRALAGWAAAFDRAVLDRAVVGVAGGIGRSGAALRRLQSGYLRHYAAFVLIGTLLILAYWMWR